MGHFATDNVENLGREKLASTCNFSSLERIFQMNALPPDSQRTAYHEAGHATIGRVLTLVCGPATIEPNFEKMSAGNAITFDVNDCDAAWRERGKWRTEEGGWLGRILTFMAGAETEVVFFGHFDSGDGNDKYQIALMAEELPTINWTAREPRLRAMTRHLVRHHRARIERVAQALLDQRTASAEELDRLVGRSVADVKVNAPAWWLAKYGKTLKT
jgi:ATP-dependent Zn protease